MQTTKVHQNLIGKSYDETVKQLEITSDDGDCCGFASCTEPDAVPSDINTSELVLKDCVLIEYYSPYGNDDRKVLNFIFVNPKGDELLLGYELCAGSGSGWNYGAWVTLNLDGEELARVEW